MCGDYRQTTSYLDALERGRAGERYLYEELSKRLEGTGLGVRLATEDNHEVPFDLEVLEDGRIIVGIENKDLSGADRGTEITKVAKRRKLQYAMEHRIPVIMTTVTRRKIEAIGWKEGLVNGHPTVFDYDVGRLVDRILSARQGTPT
jgi:hypothetical protein